MVSLDTYQPEDNEAIFRSAPMTLVQFYVTAELARDLVYTLGQLGNVHFRDLNSKLTPFQRTYINELRAIDSIASKISDLKNMMLRFQISLPEPSVHGVYKMSTTSEMDTIKESIENTFEKVVHLVESYDELLDRKQKYIENRSVLHAVNEFHNASLMHDTNDLDYGADFEQELETDIALLNENTIQMEEARLDSTDLEGLEFNSIAGTLDTSKIHVLRNILWRVLRGNLFFHDAPIQANENYLDINAAEKKIEKSVFIIYVHGEILKNRLRKIVESLDGVIFTNVSGTSARRFDTLKELNDKIQDLDHVVKNTRDHLVSELLVFQGSFIELLCAVRMEKLIYETLNKFDMDFTRRCLIGEGWIPRAELGKIRHSIRRLLRQRTASHTAGFGSQDSSAMNYSNEDSMINDVTEESFYAVGDDASDISDDDTLVAVVNEMSTNRTPPTFHKTNKFTSAFQSIIDAYGIATYQEVNPGLATVITFPFMFAIMFGDVGHGFIVVLIALYLIINESRFGAMRNKDEIFAMAFDGRYIVLLMGVFSIYTGLIYNDIFSKSMTIFSSGWKWEFPDNYDGSSNNTMNIVAKKIPGKTYVFGLDWAWHGAENNLLFTNSFKMKLSILMGFIHMTYSLFFSLVNYTHFRSRVDIIGNFIPGFLFMQSIFGYLCITIVYKWSVDWFGLDKRPPGLLNMLINMFLAPGRIDDQLYAGQRFVQIVLVLVALVCVPWLLIYKPITLKRQNNRAIELGYRNLHSQMQDEIQQQEEFDALNSGSNLIDHNLDEVDLLEDEFQFPNDMEPMFHNSASHSEGGDGFDFGDIVIHQVIHTIEFCLNCVSHTASYLRLWALSLAHSQLSTVLWTMTIQNAFGTTGGLGIFMTVALFAMWFILTVCILVLMEGTSAMLHSLRLHWVEAMSKFFDGEGYSFEPFNFESISD